MRSVSGKQFAKLLEQCGWSLLRIHGSHHIYGKADSIVRLSVLTHKNKSIKRGLLKHLIKIADLPDTILD